MAADDVSALPQLADLRRIEELRLTDPVRGDKEMSMPAALFHFIGNIRIGRDAAVVESKHHAGIYCRHRAQMVLKGFQRQLVYARIRAGESARIELIGPDDVVIQKSDLVHAAFCCRTPMKIPLSCSTF